MSIGSEIMEEHYEGVIIPMYKDMLKEARDMLVMCSLIDKSGQCMEMVEKIDEFFAKKTKNL